MSIIVENISKIYPSGDSEFYALTSVNAVIPDNKLTIIKGRSGSGKTTLMNIMSSLDEASQGNIIFDGKSYKELSLEDKCELRRTTMGFVFQSVALIPEMTAYENIEFAMRLAGLSGNNEERIVELLTKVGLRKRINHLTYQMSGGEQQRVAIARAVAHNPKAIFCDEPTSALDTETALEITNIFKKLTVEENTTIVMTTHDVNLMEFGDVVFEIEDGKIYER